MSRLLDNLLLFARILRRAGIAADPERLLDVVKALGYVNLGARDEVYHACRTLLVNGHDQIAIFDRAFDAFWRTHHEPAAQIEYSSQRRAAIDCHDRGSGRLPQDLAAVSGRRSARGRVEIRPTRA